MDTDFPVSVECGGKRFDARAQNLTADGLQLEGPSTARVGEVFAVTFGKAGATETFRARVTWARPAGSGASQSGTFQFGCVFWAVDEEAKRHLRVRLIQFSTLHRPAPKPSEAPDPATPEALSPEESVAAAAAAAASAAGSSAAGAAAAAAPGSSAASAAKKETAPGKTQGGEKESAAR